MIRIKIDPDQGIERLIPVIDFINTRNVVDEDPYYGLLVRDKKTHSTLRNLKLENNLKE